MDQIKLKPINEIKGGFDVHDIIRAGRSQELDPHKVSILLTRIIDSLNQVIVAIEGVKK